MKCFSFQVSRQVRPKLQESQFFHVIPPKNTGRKVAPGMSVVYTICFSPQENKVLEGLVGEQSDSMMVQCGFRQSPN